MLQILERNGFLHVSRDKILLLYRRCVTFFGGLDSVDPGLVDLSAGLTSLRLFPHGLGIIGPELGGLDFLFVVLYLILPFEYLQGQLGIHCSRTLGFRDELDFCPE